VSQWSGYISNVPWRTCDARLHGWGERETSCLCLAVKRPTAFVVATDAEDRGAKPRGTILAAAMIGAN
jgi:hypothetical protein